MAGKPKLTGEKLFLRYAFPCAGAVTISGKTYRKLDEKHLVELDLLVKNAGQPRRSLFRFCFPYAFRRLREYANANGLERWALATVADFWRHHHGHTGECRVRRCTVLETGSNATMTVVACGEERFGAINPYRLPLQSGHSVYVHLRVIIEIDEDGIGS